MGYDLRIGELRINKEPDDGLESSCISFSAEAHSLPDAPAFGEPTDFTNGRWPSYSSWSNAMKEAGLYDVFFFQGNLIGGHPGVRLVTAEMAAAIQDSKARLEKDYPGIKAEYDNAKPHQGTYCRVLWLEYWTVWALSNCKTPVIANS